MLPKPTNEENRLTGRAEEVSPDENLARALEGLVAGRLSPLTRKAYRHDAALFVNWLSGQDLRLSALTRSDVERYQVWLVERYTINAAARKLVVTRRLLEEAVERG